MNKKLWMLLSAVSSLALAGTLLGIIMSKKGGCPACKGGSCCCGSGCK